MPSLFSRFLSALVVLPPVNCQLDVSLLPLLRPTTEKDDDLVPVLAEINPVAGTEIEPVFKHPKANSLNITEIALFHTEDRSSHSRSLVGMQIEKPLLVRAFPAFVYVLSGNRQADPAEVKNVRLDDSTTDVTIDNGVRAGIRRDVTCYAWPAPHPGPAAEILAAETLQATSLRGV